LRTAAGGLLILDAGTGIRALGRALLEASHGGREAEPGGPGAYVAGEIFLTHFHWDHIQGLPFFAPLYRPGHRFTVWHPRAAGTDAARVLREQMAPAVFPVGFEQLQAGVELREVAEGRRQGAGYSMSAIPVRHPGGALGYRFAGGDGRGVVYIPDNELDPAAEYVGPADWRARLVEFVHGARVLVHDGMYTAVEYDRRRGWGHSTYLDAVALALDAGVATLALFHHAPERSDAEVDAIVEECRAVVTRKGGTLDVIAAAEGMRMAV
jgi:ribonuclease BN (tRNA processing enzyme)